MRDGLAAGDRVQLHINNGRNKAYIRNGLDWIKRFPVGRSAAFLSGPVKPASGPSRHLAWAQQSDRVQVKADIKWQAGSVANGSVAVTCS